MPGFDPLFPRKNLCLHKLFDFSDEEHIRDYISYIEGNDLNDFFLNKISLFKKLLLSFDNEIQQTIETTNDKTIDFFFSQLNDNIVLLNEAFDFDVLMNNVVIWNKEALDNFTDRVEKESDVYFAQDERKYGHLEEYESWETPSSLYGWSMGDPKKVKKINCNFYCINHTPNLIDLKYLDGCFKLLIELRNDFLQIANKYLEPYTQDKKMKHTSPKGENYFLIIAIDKYIDTGYLSLNNAKLDAERFSKVLMSKYGFKPIQEPLLDIDANHKNIIDALNSLSYSLNENDNIIIYFAGHGSIHPKTKFGYWIPSDSDKSLSSFIPNSTVIDMLIGIEAKHILLISDSCFSGTFLTRTRDGNPLDAYHKISDQKSRWYIASGREEKVSDGLPGAGSPFAISITNFFEHNKEKKFSVSDLCSTVIRETGNVAKQQPIFGQLQNVGDKGGQMIFEVSELSPLNNQEILPPAKDSETNEFVTPYDISKAIKMIGIEQKSIFGYYDIQGKIVVRKVDGIENFLCSAFIFDELVNFIPAIIDVDRDTYLARFDGWDKVNETELEHLHAEVSYQKTWVSEAPYMAICRCNGRMVAFSKSNDELYNNLICWGKNQSEAAGKMLLALYNEGKIKINPSALRNLQ